MSEPLLEITRARPVPQNLQGGAKSDEARWGQFRLTFQLTIRPNGPGRLPPSRLLQPLLQFRATGPTQVDDLDCPPSSGARTRRMRSRWTTINAITGRALPYGDRHSSTRDPWLRQGRLEQGGQSGVGEFQAEYLFRKSVVLIGGVVGRLTGPFVDQPG